MVMAASRQNPVLICAMTVIDIGGFVELVGSCWLVTVRVTEYLTLIMVLIGFRKMIVMLGFVPF